MAYEPQEVSVNILSGSNWSSLLKFWLLNVVVSIVTVLVIVLIFKIVVGGGVLLGTATSEDGLKGAIAGGLSGLLVAGVLSVIAVIMGQMALLTTYESWDGCNKPKSS
jgi:hypothetical protein